MGCGASAKKQDSSALQEAPPPVEDAKPESVPPPQDLSLKAVQAQQLLWRSAAAGNQDGIRKALAEGADVNAKNEVDLPGFTGEGRTAFIYAAANGQPACMRILKDAGADVNAGDKDNWSAVHFAAGRGSIECLEALHAFDANLHALTKWNRNAYDMAFDDAVEEDETNETSEWLSKRGLGFSLQGRLLHNARFGNCKGVEEALNAGAEINLPNWCGFTVSHCAAKGQAEVLKLLHNKGADFTKLDEDGWSVVHFAAVELSIDCLQVLADVGIDLHGLTKFKKNALDLVIYDYDENAQEDDGERSRAPEVIQWLTKQGLSPSPQGMLSSSARWSKCELLQKAVDEGADVNFKYRLGVTALHSAAECGNADTIRKLVELGADLELSDEDGWTAVHWASERARLENLKALCEVGANLKALTVYKKNAYDIRMDALVGEDSSKDEIIVFLKEKGVEQSPQGQLWLAAQVGDASGVKEAISRGAEINFRDRLDKSAADYADEEGREGCLAFLIAQGADFHR